MERFAGHYISLAEKIVAQPERSIWDYDFLSDRERTQIREFQEGGPVAAVSSEPVHRLFEQQAEKAPQQTALVCGQQSLSYLELNQRANQAARLLQAQGMGERSLVACRLERSADAAMWLLAIWKVGGVYLPLDVASPPARCANDERLRRRLAYHAIRLGSAMP